MFERNIIKSKKPSIKYVFHHNRNKENAIN